MAAGRPLLDSPVQDISPVPSQPQWENQWTFFRSKLSLFRRKAFYKEDLALVS